MRKYSHLVTLGLGLGRSKGLSISNKRCIQLAYGSIRSHLAPRSPPFHNYSHPTLSNLNHHYHAQAQPSYHVSDYPLDYQITVKDRAIVRAAEAPKNEFWLPLSNLDLLLPPLVPGVFFCYKKRDGISTDAVVESLKKSLAVVLSTFYPLAGEIVLNRHGEPELVCNNNGVELVYAHADVDLETLDIHHPDETVKGKLIPNNINHGVITLQVTELKCGSVILSCAFDHRIADAESCNLFLVALANIAKSNKISNTPSFRTSIISPSRPPRYDSTFDDLYIPISSMPNPPPSYQDQLQSRIYYIKAESINRLQSEASTKETRISKVQSFTAYIWKLLAQQGDDDVNKTSRVGVIVSGRHLLTGNNEEKSPLLKNHQGNIISIPYGKADNRNLKEMTLNEVAKKVNEFVTNARNGEHFRGLVDWVELHRPEPSIARVYLKLQESDGDAIVVSSGQGFPIKDMQFGWGEPDFGIYHFPWGGQTGYITTMPSTKNNGDWVVYTHLKQKHLDFINSKATHIFKPVYLHSW